MPGWLIVVLIIVALIVVLLVVLLVNAATLKPTPLRNPLPPSTARGDEGAVARFQEILRCPTVWAAEDPDADHTPFDEFVPLLKRLYPRVFATLELTMVNTYGIVLHWRGQDSTAAPVLLLAHHDVVAARPEGWSHPPFAAEIVDGVIYARGTLDNKSCLTSLLEATETLLADGFTPARDVYLCSSNNEEDMGDTAPAMVKLFEEKGIKPLFVLDEGGAVIDNPPLGVKGQFAAIGVSEKGNSSTSIVVHADGGHASTPSLEDATAKLVLGLESLLTKPAPAAIAAPVATMLRELAAKSGFGLRLVFGNLWLFRPLVLSILKKNAETAAMVRTTYALTELEGSQGMNIIPTRARAAVNIRVDPSETAAQAIDRLRPHFPDGTEFLPREAVDPSPISVFDDEVFDYVRSVTVSVYPDATASPYIQSSASDARHFARICPHTYRFAGILYGGDRRERIHGDDENLDVDSFLHGIGFYIELIRHLEVLHA